MFNVLKTAAIAGLISLCALVAAAPAQADALYLKFGDGGHARFGVHIGDGLHYRRYYRDEFRHERRCTPERALQKARRIGVNRARIDFVSRRAIGIVGRSRGERVYLTFARSPRCPIIG